MPAMPTSPDPALSPDAPACLIGVDFSSAPSRRKPIVVAQGRLVGAVLRFEALHTFDSLPAWGAWLADTPAWRGGFDLPFGLPRELVQALGWPTDWAACMDHYASLDRPTIRDTFAAFCDARPVGAKFAHRACDGPAGSSPSMKWVNPPVAYMLHAGLPWLRAAGAWLPAHQPAPAGCATDQPAPAGWAPDHPAPVGCTPDQPAPAGAAAAAPRTALEAYPGLLARAVLGKRSYKSDTVAKQTPERLIARKDLVEALEQGRSPLGLRLKLSAAQRDGLVADASGDRLDAVLCMLQVAWGVGRPNFGLPAAVDPLEGWIVSA